ncbi:hypothetical protein [Conexibacter sp. DBS9H8]|uniref:hypothetical protein n=1 Tax=Conexibacter sp. DBS9H8 TaxID=2937801 RepID=UPI00200D0536|nr:hypothetical protein [Conexibacter sp. DBS9H8]
MLSACGAQSGPSSVATGPPSAATAGLTSTTTTYTYTVVGTTPSGQTETETDAYVSTTPAGPNGVALEPGPLLPAASPSLTGQTIDGIGCSRLTQLAYQAYAHLQIDRRGRPQALPGGIGLVTPVPSATGTVTTYSADLCSYWIHTRAANGLIEVDSPAPETFTLGDLFDIWGQPLGVRRVAGDRGRVTAIVNGRRWHGSPRAIPLREHESIELAVGRPIPRFHAVDWAATQL